MTFKRHAAGPPRSHLGRHVYGIAAIAFGVLALVRHDFHGWPQFRPILSTANGPVFAYTVGTVAIIGGAALQFRRTAKAGAFVLAVVYLIFACSYVPRILATPSVYDRWGNFFEQFSLLTGAAIVYARLSMKRPTKTLTRFGRVSLGVCAASFAAEQAVYLTNTATLVPKWLPPNPTFWAIATTAAFALASVALVTGRSALLAARLLTTMLVSFGLVVWLPILRANSHDRADWSETIETFAIAGAAWILADLLSETRRRPNRIDIPKSKRR